MNAENTTYAALFNLFTYWDYSEEVNSNKTLSQILQDASQSKYADSDYYRILQDAVTRYPELRNATIKSPSWKMNEQYNAETRACVFELGNGDKYVAYRGTGDGGWIDNGEGVTQESTGQQKEAARYFDQVARQYGWTQEDNIYVTGHSKGGNKAQYVTLMAEYNNLIDRCYSMDGQGFSDAAIRQFKEKYGEEGYQEILDKMYAYNGKNDYVSPLVNPVISKEHTTYLDTIENPNGGIKGKYAGYHMLEMFFRLNEDEEFEAVLVPETERAELGDFADKVSRFLMSLPMDERKAAAMTIMQLLEMSEDRIDGVDGKTVTLRELIKFGAKVPTPLLLTVFTSKAGWKMVWKAIKDIFSEGVKNFVIIVIKLLVIAPVAIFIMKEFHKVTSILDFIIDEINKLGEAFRMAAQAFESCVHFLKKKGDEFVNWIKNLVRSADYSYFLVEVNQMRLVKGELETEKRKLRNEAVRIRKLRREINFGLLTQQALYFRLVSLARTLEQEAFILERMSTSIQKCIETYERNERKVVQLYQAI